MQRASFPRRVAISIVKRLSLHPLRSACSGARAVAGKLFAQDAISGLLLMHLRQPVLAAHGLTSGLIYLRRMSEEDAMTVSSTNPNHSPHSYGNPTHPCGVVHVDSKKFTQLNDLRLLLKQIYNIENNCNFPSSAQLRIKHNDLVVKDSNGGYQELIKDFRFASDHGGSLDKLMDLGISSKATRGATFERFRCSLSRVWNQLTKCDVSDARSEHLSLDFQQLRSKACYQFSLLRADRDTFAGKHVDDLGDIGLIGLDLRSCNFENANLMGRDLSGCSLPLNLKGANLINTDMRGVTFGRESPAAGVLRDNPEALIAWSNLPPYPDFAAVDLKGGKLTMPSPFEKTTDSVVAVLQRYYDPLKEKDSILRSIDSIGDISLKRQVMDEHLALLMDKTSAKDRALICKPLADVLFKTCYLDSALEGSAHSIRALANELVEHHFATGDKRLLNVRHLAGNDHGVFLEEHLRHAQGLVNACIVQGRTQLEDAHATYCQQLIQECALPSRFPYRTELQDQAMVLQQAIYKLPAYAVAVNTLGDAMGHSGTDSVPLGDIAVFPRNGWLIAMPGGYYRSFMYPAMDDETPHDPNLQPALFKPDAQGNIKQDNDSYPYMYMGMNIFLREFLMPKIIRVNQQKMRG